MKELIQNTAAPVTRSKRQRCPPNVQTELGEGSSRAPADVPYRSRRAAAPVEPITPQPPVAKRQRRRKPKKTPDALGGKPIPSEARQLKPPTVCRKCSAKRFEYETKGFCCCDGDVTLAYNEYPDELVCLFTASDPDALHFQKYSRLYNNVFAFTSLGGTFDAKTQKGIYVFKAHGQMYHNLPNLIPMDTIPRYLQLYFYDAQHEKANRLGLFPQLEDEIVTSLMGIMDANPYGRFFRCLREVEVTQETRIMIASNPGQDQRVYNAPTSDEVAAVWLDSTSYEGNAGPHIVAYGKADRTHTIKHYYGCYDPLQYPLLLPKGESGWRQGLKKVSGSTTTTIEDLQFPMSEAMNDEPNSLIPAEVQNAARRHTRADKYISCREYYAYKFQIRPGNFLLRGGRLFQQFIVDMYVKIENTRLDFFRLNQDAIRADLYQGILDTLELGENSAAQVEMPHALRRLFATILIFNCPNNPQTFWEKYFPALSEDFKKKFGDDEQKILKLTATKVEEYLEGMGKTFEMFGLSHLHFEEDVVMHNTRDIFDALNAPVPLEQLASRKDLNAGQRAAYKTIMYHVKNDKPGAFFIDGPGGTGKTFLYGALYAKVRSMGKICLPTATSGIAASNLPTGRTCHSRFKIPLESDESLTCNVPKQGCLACLLREASLIIWDEASMAKKENIQAVNLLLQDVCSSTELFGGKIVVFGGDFRQVLPVLPRRTQQECVDASIVSSEIWPCLQKFKLTENIRARADPEFSDFLLKLGNGDLQATENGYVTLPPELILQPTGGPCPLQDLVDNVFPEVRQVTFSPEIFNDRAILTPRNADVDSINKLLIEKFPGDGCTYKSFDTVLDDSSNVYPAEFLNTLCPPGMTPHELVVKKDSPVILLRNIDPAAGLCNGTRLICKAFFPNMIECEISTGFYAGERVFLPRITLKPSKSSKYPINFQRKQFPIKLSFAMTINKAQGQTLQRVGVFLPKPCFSHGQLYVALSRARTAKQCKVLNGENEDGGESGDRLNIKNIVSFEMLRRAGIKA